MKKKSIWEMNFGIGSVVVHNVRHCKVTINLQFIFRCQMYTQAHTGTHTHTMFTNLEVIAPYS
jgi:hypothetical protein